MLLTLMCLRTKKNLMATGCGMTMLIYLSATNFDTVKSVSVLCGNNRIQKSNCDYYIDPATGDYLSL
jgi:hypothetical protein